MTPRDEGDRSTIMRGGKTLLAAFTLTAASAVISSVRDGEDRDRSGAGQAAAGAVAAAGMASRPAHSAPDRDPLLAGRFPGRKPSLYQAVSPVRPRHIENGDGTVADLLTGRTLERP
jgi:hypothetical protein